MKHPPQTEEGFQAAVIEYAQVRRWSLVYHTRDSRRSREGFPDLVLVRDERIVFAELKRDGKYPTDEQQLWLDGLDRVAAAAAALEQERVHHGIVPVAEPPIVRVFLWRPADWPSIEKELK